MRGIGEFAQMAKVSVRTLRHYDHIGLLTPADVDPSTGYRSYDSAQLVDMHQILALKDAGLSLDEIRTALAGPSDDLAALLRKRLVDLEAELAAESRRVERLRARLRLIQGESAMTDTPLTTTDHAVVVKPLDPHRVAVATEVAADFEVDFGPIFARLYPVIFGELGRLGIAPGSPTIAFYEPAEGGGVVVAAGVPIAAGAVVESDVIEARELPSAERGATLMHLGSMDTIDNSYAALDRWVADAGEAAVGYSREIYHQCPPDQADWVTELQFVLRGRAGKTESG